MLQAVRGTHDLYGDAYLRHDFILKTVYELAYLYGFQPMETPIFEFTPVFARTLGDTSDVVNKEMYQLEDRGGESLTLRPEHTAGVMRAVLSNNLHQNLPLKLISSGPVFRYERPQKGRYRQFNQVGIELIGAQSPAADAEVISVAQHMFKAFGVDNKMRLEINTLGDTESRNLYRERLIEYFEKYKDDLSEDSQHRLTRNPLRILDSKNKRDQEIAADAPQMRDALTDDAKAHFDAVLAHLQNLDVPFVLNPNIVRGLDYYCHTTFEFKASDGLGSQDTVLAGGRYDGLSGQMDGPPLPSIGWAAGVERLSFLIESVQAKPASLPIVTVRGVDEPYALKLAQILRAAHIAAEVFYSGNMQKQMKKAHKMGAPYVAIVGEDEAKNNTVVLKNFDDGSQKTMTQDELVHFLKTLGV